MLPARKSGTAPLVLSPELQADIRAFLEQSGAERELFAFIPFIRQIRTTLDQHQVAYFVEELSEMVELVATVSAFRAACSHFDFLRKRLAEENDTSLQPIIGRLCLEAEEHLAAMFAELGYLAHYTLAAVKQIMVRKFRHHDRARFEHVVVRLVDLLGGMDEEEETFSEFLDSQSVLVTLKK